MDNDIERLRRDVEKIRRGLVEKESELKRIENSCLHEWGPVKDVSEYIPAHVIPGDPPGTMGVDWRGPVHVPAETIHRWSKTCLKCGRVITTSKRREKKSYEPDFG